MARISTPGGSSLPSGGTDGQVLVKAGAGATWGTVAGGGGPVADATPAAKGIVQLAGDLGGTAAAPTVAKINGATPAAVATTGAYSDLTGKPAIPTVGAAGAGAAVALSSTDASVTNARTPTAHAASHATGGSDPVTPAAIGAVASTTITAIVKLTQAAYNAIGAPDAATLYVIVG